MTETAGRYHTVEEIHALAPGGRVKPGVLYEIIYIPLGETKPQGGVYATDFCLFDGLLDLPEKIVALKECEPCPPPEPWEWQKAE